MNRKRRILHCTESTWLQTGYSRYSHEVLSRLHATGKYDIAELGAYGLVNDPRAGSVKWKYYFNTPRNQAEDQVYRSNALNEFGAWKFEEVALDFMPDIVCVPPGELVMTLEGYRPIEDLRTGERVLTHTGSWQPISATMRRQYMGELIYLYFNGCPEPLKVTKEHPVLVYRKMRQTNQKKSIGSIYKDIEPEFIPACEVNTGDLVVVNPPKASSIKEICITDYLSQFILDDDGMVTIDYCGHDTDKPLPASIPVNRDLGEFLGYYLGDGCCQPRGLTFTFHEEETRFVDDVIRLAKSLFGLTATSTPDKNKKCTVVFVNSTLLANFIRNWAGRTIAKHIPSTIWLASRETQEGVLAGLVKSDGCYKKNTVAIATFSRRLAHEYRMLCSCLQIPTNITFSRHHGKNGSYEVVGFGNSAEEMHEIAKKHESASGTVAVATRRARRTQFVNGHLVASVRRIRTTPYSGQVYNIDVEKDHSYCVQQSIVHNCDIRDHWMVEFQQRSPFRPYYHWTIMPACDAEPQNEQWIETYMTANSVFSYSDWGLETLRKQSCDRMSLISSAPPGFDPECYYPMPNREQLRLQLCIPANSLVVGTVMRNQARKLFPDLFHAFARYLQEAPLDIAKKTFLYCHTSFPDVGWNLSGLLKENGIAHRTLFTYRCKQCGAIFASLFQDARGICRRCTGPFAAMPNSTDGIPDKVLGSIYNCFDLYVQMANSEGFGISQVEAAACGVPVASVDYSAMSDVVRKLKGFPIKVKSLVRESMTHCHRATPDEDDFLNVLTDVLLLPDSLRRKHGMDARRAVEQHYTWDRTAKIWENHFDSVATLPQEATWLAPPRFHQPQMEVPQGLNHEQFVRWGLTFVAGRPDLVNSYMAMRMIRDLNREMTTNQGMGGLYFNDASALGAKLQPQPFGREQAMQELIKICQVRNHWESRRAARLKERKS